MVLGSGTFCVEFTAAITPLSQKTSKTQRTWVEFTAESWRDGTKDTLLMPWNSVTWLAKDYQRGWIQIKHVEKMNCNIKCCSYAVLWKNTFQCIVLYQQWRRRSYISTCIHTCRYTHMLAFVCVSTSSKGKKPHVCEEQGNDGIPHHQSVINQDQALNCWEEHTSTKLVSHTQSPLDTEQPAFRIHGTHLLYGIMSFPPLLPPKTSL